MPTVIKKILLKQNPEMWRGLVKIIVIIECLNLSDYGLKIACYNHSMEYMKHIVTTNQKSVRGIQEIKRKKSKHNPVESHQHPRE